jgi:hypothetical protein
MSYGSKLPATWLRTFNYSFGSRVCLKLLRSRYVIVFDERIIYATCGDHITGGRGFVGHVGMDQVQEGMGGHGISHTCENHAGEKLGRNVHQIGYLLGNPKATKPLLEYIRQMNRFQGYLRRDEKWRSK